MQSRFFRLTLIVSIALASVIGVATAQTADSVTAAPRKSHLHRNLAIGNVVGGAGFYLYFKDTWGASTGKFHIKNEFNDHVGFSDEISHFYVSYKLTEGFMWLFRVLKVPPDRVNKYAALQAGLAMTLVEFPVDAFNPTQGMGFSDLVFNYGGIGYALLKQRHPSNLDMKFSVKRPPWKFDNKLLASENEEFANFIYWITYRVTIAHAGIGYSIRHEGIATTKAEYWLGAGTTAYDLISLVAPRFAESVKVLDSYFINLRVEL